MSQVENNCFNCKYQEDATHYIYSKTDSWCKKQRAWIYAPFRTCPKFRRSLWSFLFGDRTPFIRTEKLVGGCEND